MTKKELLKKLKNLENEKGVHIVDVSQNSNKATIQRAINCLKCPDEILDKYFAVFSLKYPSIAGAMEKCGDFKKHGYNRKYVFDGARSILAEVME